ncbi:MAG: hypothetical protein JWQ32_3283 [Marmoricola sp.]|nr:hypothetical protein [Marmoricola sp.]
MRRGLKTAVAVAVLASAVGIGIETPAQAATAVHGCPSGAFCIYPQNAGWNGDRPSVELWSYGPHNLSNEYGHHYVLNNQYNDPQGNPVIAVLCTGVNGTGCSGATYYQYSRSTSAGVSWGNPDLTPINSVILTVFGP